MKIGDIVRVREYTILGEPMFYHGKEGWIESIIANKHPTKIYYNIRLEDGHLLENLFDQELDRGNGVELMVKLL